MASKRKIVNVKIDRESIDHISNDIAKGHIPPLPKNSDKIAQLLTGAKRISQPSEVDRNGKHSKPKKVSQFQYYEFEYNGMMLYANVMVKQSNGTRNKEKATHRLHSITKKKRAKD